MPAACAIQVEALTPGAVMPGTFMGQRSAGLTEGNFCAPIDLPSPTGSSHVQPTKLFIGGISRRTTTKQLRDHFSKSGRVLDCVAMRTPDGRPRGFGYVTLDSPAAAERLLAEPQMIDDRIVDMKRAVPEVHTPKASAGHHDLESSGMESSMMMSMQALYAQQGMFCTWPEQSGFYYDDAFGGMGLQDMGMADSVPDCVNVLTGSLMTGQESVVDPQVLDCVDLLTGNLLAAPGLFQENLAETQAPPISSKEVGSSKEGKGLKAPLAEVTNLVGSSVQPIPAKKPATTPNPFLATEPRYVKPPQTLSASAPCFIYEDPQENEEIERETSVASTEPPSPANQAELSPQAPSVATPVELQAEAEGAAGEEVAEGLPSIGSAQHASGECRRCNFFAKGRCRNGFDCSFCHLPHDRRKMSRQEKREQEALRYNGFDGASDSSSEEADSLPSKQSGPLLSPVRARAPPGLSLENEATEKPSQILTAPLPAASTAPGPALPPGLRPPGLPAPQISAASTEKLPGFFCQAQAPPLGSLMPWEAAAGGMLSTSPCSSAGGISNATPFLLSTTPTAAVAPTLQKAVAKETRTVETQTDDDFTCPYCDECGETLPSLLSKSCECSSPKDAEQVAATGKRRRRPRPAAAGEADDVIE